MITETVYVPTISCADCTRTIEREMAKLVGMKQVRADLDSRRVTFTYEPPLSPGQLQAWMAEIGYPIATPGGR